MAKLYFTSTPSISNIWNGLKHAYNGWINPQTVAQTGEAPSGFIRLGTPVKIVNGIKYYKDAMGKLKTAQEILKANGSTAIVKESKPKSWFPRKNHTDHYIPKNATGIYNELEKAAYEGEQMMKNPYMDWKDFDEINNVNYWKHGGLIKK